MILVKKDYDLKNILIFDGDCGICTKLSLYAERKIDANISVKPFFEVFEELSTIGIDFELASQTVVLIKESKIFLRSRAIFELCKEMPGLWKVPGYLFSFKLFEILFNPFYNLIAKNRAKISKILGLDACKLNYSIND